MTRDELTVMNGGNCILQLRGVRPFMSDKYDITKHPNYEYLADVSEKNRYHVEEELRRQYMPVPDEMVELNIVDATDMPEEAKS